MTNLNEMTGFESLLNDSPDTGVSELAQSGYGFTDQGGASVSNESIIGYDEDEEKPDTVDEGNDKTDYSDNAVYSFLQDHGIKDPSKIKFEDEDGNLTEKNFNDLSFDEQKNILSDLVDPGISEYEYSVINYLRNNNATLEDVVNHFAEQRLQEYLKENPAAAPQEQYSIDQLTDEQLYLGDLKLRNPDFTDEELIAKLEDAQKNEALFEKEVNTLRTTYKAKEDENRAAEAQREQMEYEDLKNNLMEAARDFNEIAISLDDPESESIVIEDADKIDALNYYLQQDATGKSQFAKDMENPDALIELAWLRTKGAEVLSGIHRYYKDELKKAHKENADLRRKIEKSEKTANNSVVVPAKSIESSERKVKNLGDAWSHSDLWRKDS